jgi:hypothetical protein
MCSATDDITTAKQQCTLAFVKGRDDAVYAINISNTCQPGDAHDTSLCCVVLCCVVLCCAVLCCAVLCCVVLCCAVLCCVVLCCVVLCCIVSYRIVSYRIVSLSVSGGALYTLLQLSKS